MKESNAEATTDLANASWGKFGAHSSVVGLSRWREQEDDHCRFLETSFKLDNMEGGACSSSPEVARKA